MNIMNTLCLGSQSKHNFWYDNGVGAATSIITLLALLVTLGNIIWTNYKEKQEEKKKSIKILKLIDLLTEKHNKQIKEFNNNYSILDSETPNKDGFYRIDDHSIPYKTKQKTSYVVARSLLFIQENNLKDKLTNYENEIKKILIKQNKELKFDDLEKITNKLDNINYAISLINKCSDSTEINDLLKENKLDLLEDELVIYKDLYDKIEQINTDLYNKNS